ncbi:Ribonuclease HII [compost metagenome]
MASVPIDKSSPENLEFEKELWEFGYDIVAGVDDVGRGCFAGPVVCASAIMPKGLRLDRLTDSKLINKKEHQYFSDLVKENADAWGVGVVDVETVDKINIKQASRLAMKIAVESMDIKPQYLLIDGDEKIDLLIPQASITKGDFRSHSISAASIIAKLYRDELMKKLDEEYDFVYGWSKNAGYQTKDHIEACYKYGLTPYHRKSWKTMELFTNE